MQPFYLRGQTLREFVLICPTTTSIAIQVIPADFKTATAAMNTSKYICIGVNITQGQTDHDQPLMIKYPYSPSVWVLFMRSLFHVS
jgi:hypothetical protein